MEKPPYFTLRELVQMIDRPPGAREGCLSILDHASDRFKWSPGSTRTHHTWIGGYWDHVCEAMNLAVVLHRPLEATGRPLPFALPDALLALFLHDLEKPWKYERHEDKIRILPELEAKEAQHEFRLNKAKEFDIPISDVVENAIRFSEGEGNEHTSTGRQAGELAAFVHACDHLSARLYHSHPVEFNDPWSGPKRPSVSQ